MMHVCCLTGGAKNHDEDMGPPPRAEGSGAIGFEGLGKLLSCVFPLSTVPSPWPVVPSPWPATVVIGTCQMWIQEVVKCFC